MTQSSILNNGVGKQSQGPVSPQIFVLLILYTALWHSPIWLTKSVLIIFQGKHIREQLRYHAQFSVSCDACDHWPLQTAQTHVCLSFHTYDLDTDWASAAHQFSLPWWLQRRHYLIALVILTSTSSHFLGDNSSSINSLILHTVLYLLRDGTSYKAKVFPNVCPWTDSTEFCRGSQNLWNPWVCKVRSFIQNSVEYFIF